MSPCAYRKSSGWRFSFLTMFFHLEIWGKMSPLVEHETRFSEGWVVQSPSFLNFDDCFAMASMF